MESKKHIVSSKDRKEVRNRVWDMLADDRSKNDIYKELVKDYESELFT